MAGYIGKKISREDFWPSKNVTIENMKWPFPLQAWGFNPFPTLISKSNQNGAIQWNQIIKNRLIYLSSKLTSTWLSPIGHPLYNPHEVTLVIYILGETHRFFSLKFSYRLNLRPFRRYFSKVSCNSKKQN